MPRAYRGARVPWRSAATPRLPPGDRYARRVRRLLEILPGLAWVSALTAVAFVGARLGPAQLLGPLVLALLLGAALRLSVRRAPPGSAAGVAFAARTLLRVGIVLLGVRLDGRALVDLGPWVLLGSAVGALVAFAVVEVAGRAWRVPSDLRRLVAIGTAICGAAAVAAATPLMRRSAGEPATPGGAAPLAIATISLLGTLGVLGFVALDLAGRLSPAFLAAWAGATLQEVGQAVAAGTAVGGDRADLALLVKLSRVVWLAPALVALAFWTRPPSADGARGRADGEAAGAGHGAARRTPWVPAFVIGFVAMGAATSAGLLPPPAVAAATTAGTILTAAAMAAIGLGVDATAVGRSGRQALALGTVGFGALVVVMGAWYGLLLR